jgi:hypothetical protein
VDLMTETMASYNVWHILFLLCFAWFATLTGVITGAYSVFRTKREGYEPFFPGKQPKGEAFNIDDDFDDLTGPPVNDIPEEARAAHDQFMSHFAERMMDRHSGGSPGPETGLADEGEDDEQR